MKMFVVLALAAFAAAEPEADPQLLLGGVHGVHSSYTPYSHVAPVATYASPLWNNMIPALKSVVPAVKTVVPEVKPVVSTPVISSYTGLGAQYPLTYGAQYPLTYGAQYPLTYGAQYRMPYGVQYPITHAVHKREAEADPALVYSGLIRTPFTGINTPYTAGMISPYTGINTPYTAGMISPYTGLTHKTVVPAVSSYSHGIQYPMTYGVPAVKSVVSTPVVSSYTGLGAQYPLTYGAQYPMTYGVQYPMTHGVIAEPTKVVTNYINKDHYTAEATPLGKALGVPSYTAKNGEVVHEVQKREADPALVYSGLTHTPFSGINTPYTAGMISPYTGLTHGIQYPMTYGSQYPMTYGVPAVKSVVSTPVVSSYTGLTHTPVYKTQDHGVVATYAGLVHSSHAGLCLNNEGVQVSC